MHHSIMHITIIYNTPFVSFVFQAHDEKEILECLLGSGSKKQYSESVRSFALTLHFHSPRAYTYLRVKFNDNLPHVGTIRNWYMNSGANGEPGFCRQSFNTLKGLAAKYKNENKQLFCALVFDEMSIRKHLQWSDSRKQFLGTINYGFKSNNEEMPLAKNALVYMLNGINANFNIPIAFYFIETLTASEKANQLTEILIALADCNIRVLTITFDGLCTNIKMCRLLGASFEQSDYKPYFPAPNDPQQKIYIILDPSHMEKLARNCLAGKKVLLDDNGSEIKWSFFEMLENFRNERGFTLTHKLNKKHIQWFRAKMNVRLAVETLSNSVADSMEFLKDRGFEEFSDATATIKFVRTLNNIFDVMNSKRIVDSNVFKSALHPPNHKYIFDFFDEVILYLQTLKMPDGGAIISSKCRTSFRGFIINMINLKSIYKDCIETGLMDFLPTYKFSQDHLECFFGRIRSLNGYNDNNPTVEQFCSAFRKTVINKELTSSEFGNCKDSLNILFISSRRPKLKSNKDLRTISFDQLMENTQHVEKRDQIEHCDYLLEDLEHTSISYSAGCIENKIENSGRFVCAECTNVFFENDKIVESIRSSKTQTPRLRSRYVVSHKNTSRFSKQVPITNTINC